MGDDRVRRGGRPVLITDINGDELTASMGSYCRAVEDIKSGDSVSMTVIDNPSKGRSKPRRVRIKFE